MATPYPRTAVTSVSSLPDVAMEAAASTRNATTVVRRMVMVAAVLASSNVVETV
jgi:hypothetical protein